MTYPPVWFFLVKRATAALSSGRAPSCWRRALGGEIERLSTVLRESAWIKEFGATHLKLRQAPLLGSALLALTEQAGQVQETNWSDKARFAGQRKLPPSHRNKASANAFSAAPFPMGDSDHRSATKRSSFGRKITGDPTPVPKLETQVERSLLHRLAGGELSSTGRQQVRSSQMKIKARGSKAGFLAVHRDLYPPVDLPSRLVQRVKKVMGLRQEGAVRTAKAAQGDAQFSDRWPSLTAQWAMPLNGTSAPLDLLDWLAYRHVGVSCSRQPPALGKPGKSAQRSDKRGGWRGRSANAGAVTTSLTTQAGLLAAPEPGVSERVGYSEWRTAFSIPRVSSDASSLLGLLLPQLPQRVGVPLPLGVSAIARQGAREEGVQVADDLEGLAAKIKQILDEQARRHGIDV
jgi:hypothetical protein